MGLFGDIVKEVRAADRVNALIREHDGILKNVENNYKQWAAIKEKEFKEQDVKGRVYECMEKAKASGLGLGISGFDFSSFDSLTFEERHSSYMKSFINDMISTCYKTICEAFFKSNFSPDKLVLLIEPLTYFDELREEVRPFLRHMDYFKSCGTVKSVLTGEADAKSAMSEIYGLTLDGLHDDIFDFVAKNSDAHDYYVRGQYKEAARILLAADYDESYFEDAKRLLIQTAMMSAMNADDADVKSTYEGILDTEANLLKYSIVFVDKDGTSKYTLLPIDTLVAKAIVYSNTRSLNLLNDEIKEYINVGKTYLPEDQYEVLRNVFFSLGGFEQELLLLEGMNRANIPMNEMQISRLKFLRNIGKAEKSNDSLGTIVNLSKTDDGILLYEYGSVSWNNDKTSQYFDTFSRENIKAGTILTVDEWTKNMRLSGGASWDLISFLPILEKRINYEFGEGNSVSIVKSRSTVDSEVDECIFIRGDNNSRFPWISFLINGDLVTRNQLALSIFVLYDCSKDFAEEQNVIDGNNRKKNRFNSIKDKLFPKLNNYINTVQAIVVEEMEKYLNSTVGTDGIY